MGIYKEDIEWFLAKSGKEYRHTEEGNIVTQDIIYFFDDSFKLVDVGINNLDQYRNWEN